MIWNIEKKTVCAIHRTNVLQMGNIDQFYASTKHNKPGTVCITFISCDVIMGAMASQITSLTSVYSIAYSAPDQRKTSKLRVTGLCAGNSPVTGEFPAQMTSNAENVSIWWRHQDTLYHVNLQYIAFYSGYAIGLIVFHIMGLAIKYAHRIDRIYAKNRTSSLNVGMDTQNWT